MSEQFTSKQDRADTVDAVKDFVTVDEKGNAHVPAGSGSVSGKFLSNHELKMIDAHKEQIYDGMDNRESEAVLDAVGILTDPKDIRDSLHVHGILDDDEVKEWTDADIQSYIDDTRNEVQNFYEVNGSSTPAEDAVATSDYIPKHRANAEESPDQYVGRHVAENTDEDSPIFDELNASVREGESLEEYEARQAQPVNGRHRLENVSTDGLELIETDPKQKLENVSTDGLEMIETPITDAFNEAYAEQEANNASTRRLTRRQRLAYNVLHPFVGRNKEWFKKERYGKRAKMLGGVALGLAGLAGVGAVGYQLMTGDRSGGTHGNMNWLNDFLNNLGDQANDVVEKAKETTDQRSGGGSHADTLSPTDVSSGSSGGQSLETVRVNAGDGEIDVTQHILAQHGINVNPEDAQKIGEYAGVDLLLGDKNYDDTQSTLDRIGANPGVFNIRPGSADALVKAANELGMK